MLKNAMKLADGSDNKKLALSRAASVRTLATVDWVAGYLDDPDLAQTACRAIVELAHHRFLRQPNKAHFEPILRKVEATAKDKSIARACRKSSAWECRHAVFSTVDADSQRTRNP